MAAPVERVAEAVETGHLPPELLAALDRLNKALRKAGVKRPVRVGGPEALVHAQGATRSHE